MVRSSPVGTAARRTQRAGRRRAPMNSAEPERSSSELGEERGLGAVMSLSDARSPSRPAGALPRRPPHQRVRHRAVGEGVAGSARLTAHSALFLPDQRRRRLLHFLGRRAAAGRDEHGQILARPPPARPGLALTRALEAAEFSYHATDSQLGADHRGGSAAARPGGGLLAALDLEDLDREDQAVACPAGARRLMRVGRRLARWAGARRGRRSWAGGAVAVRQVEGM